MTRQLLIVSRSQQERYTYLRYVFDSETGDVMVRILSGRSVVRAAAVYQDSRRGLAYSTPP